MKSASVLLALCVCLCAAPRGHAAEGWSWSSLNPFTKSASKKKSAVKKSPTKTTRAQSASDPSVFSRMGSGAKRMYTKTADTLSFKKKKPPAKPSSRFPSNLGSKGERKKKREESSTFGSWFKKDD